jgi:folate-binding protein YgfZ
MTSVSQAARENAFFARADRGTLRVSGPDKKSWLNGVLTCDVAAVEPGHGTLGLLLNKTGKIQTDVWVVAGSDALFLALPPGKAQGVAEQLDRMLVMEDAEVGECSEARGWLVAFGPKAVELASRLALVLGGAAGSIDWCRTPGVALSLPEERLGAARAALEAAGAPLASEEEWQRFRVDQGIGLYGVDFDDTDNPHEASLDQRAVSWTKGCYLGQEVVCMQGMRGKVKRRLMLLELDSTSVPAPGTPVASEDGAELGRVTSAAVGLSTPHALALARVSGSAVEASSPLWIAGERAVVRQ